MQSVVTGQTPITLAFHAIHTSRTWISLASRSAVFSSFLWATNLSLIAACNNRGRASRRREAGGKESVGGAGNA